MYQYLGVVTALSVIIKYHMLSVAKKSCIWQQSVSISASSIIDGSVFIERMSSTRTYLAARVTLRVGGMCVTWRRRLAYLMADKQRRVAASRQWRNGGVGVTGMAHRGGMKAAL